MTSLYYHPSGRIPRTGILSVAAAGLAAACFAMVYAWLMVFASSFGMDGKAMCFLFLIAFLWFWLGGLARIAAARGKIRNPAWMARAGAGIGLLAWYVQWSAWVVMSGVDASGDAFEFSLIKSFGLLCMRPDMLFAGVISTAWTNASGALQAGLLVCWCTEFCAHLLPPMLEGRERAGLPFCEAGDQWARRIAVESDFEPVGEPQTAQRLLEGDPGRFASMLVPRSPDAPGNHVRATIYRCTGPESFITIRHYEAMARESIPLPPEVVNAMAAGQPDAGCFLEVPVVELLCVPVADAEALLRQWAGEAQPSGMLAKS